MLEFLLLNMRSSKLKTGVASWSPLEPGPAVSLITSMSEAADIVPLLKPQDKLQLGQKCFQTSRFLLEHLCGFLLYTVTHGVPKFT